MCRGWPSPWPNLRSAAEKCGEPPPDAQRPNWTSAARAWARVARLHLHHCRVFHFRLPIGSCCHRANYLDSRKKRFSFFFFSHLLPLVIPSPLCPSPVSRLHSPTSSSGRGSALECCSLSVTPPPPQVSAALLSGHRAPERITPTSCTLQLQSDNPPRRRGWCERQQRTRSRVNWAPAETSASRDWLMHHWAAASCRPMLPEACIRATTQIPV